MVNGLGGTHDSLVVEAVKLGYGSNISVYKSTSALNQTFVDSLKNNGFNMLVRSTTGYELYKALADSNASILFVMPSGSNSHVNTSITLGGIISTGAGVDSNLTGYPIHFYDTDPFYGNQSSYSNGYIAGKLAYIKDRLGCSWAEILYWLEFGKVITLKNGYGKIDVSGVIDLYGKYHRKLYIVKH